MVKLMLMGSGAIVASIVMGAVFLIAEKPACGCMPPSPEAKAIYAANIQAGRDALAKAEKAGTPFVLGDAEISAADNAKLFAPFLGDKQIVDVLYKRTYMNNHRRKLEEVRALSDAPERKNFSVISNGATSVDEGALSINYGLGADGSPVIVAKKIVPGKANDWVNLGGELIVIVPAEMDETFRRVMRAMAEHPKGETPAPVAK